MVRLPSQKAAKKRDGTISESSVPATATDPRFAHIATDPRFRLPSKKHAKVELDERFAKVLVDDDFAKTAKVDRYGRKISSDTGRKELERLYRMEGDDLSESDEEDEEEKLADPAREGFDYSSSDEESSEEDEDEDLEVDEKTAAEETLKQDEVPMGEPSRRIAVVNLDWDNIRAIDLLAVFKSFVPEGGRIENITVYPSQFGKERLEREEYEGPPPELFQSESDDDEEATADKLVKEDKGEDYDSAKLRRYQLERLRYFYAVLTVDSPATGHAIYTACDGTEFQSTANHFDLRFIPEEVSFEEDIPRDEASSIPENYRPNEFVTDALQHSKVKLTWDEDDTFRKESTKKAFAAASKKKGRNEQLEEDLQIYLASSSISEEEPDDEEVDGESGAVSRKEAEKARLRALLGLTDNNPLKKKATGDMQITFSSGLTNSKKKDSVFEAASSDDENETTLDKYVRKERERKKKRKERTKGLAAPDDDAANGDGGKDQEDLGFDDPFFLNPDAEKRKKKAEKKNQKRLLAAAMAEDEEVLRQKAGLDLLVLPDQTGADGEDGPATRGGGHFSMPQILKHEKEAAKKLKRKQKKDKFKSKSGPENASDLQKGFKLDAEDPRFRGLFEESELAIDPSHKKFVRTSAMLGLLEEGRKKRAKVDVGHRGDGESASQSKGGSRKESSRNGDGGYDDDLPRLVQKIKSRATGEKK
jgi:hypothetical protein